jgi:hypothetical protein
MPMTSLNNDQINKSNDFLDCQNRQSIIKQSIKSMIIFRVKEEVNQFIYKLIHSLPPSRFHLEPMKRYTFIQCR